MNLEPGALAVTLLGSSQPSRADVWCHRRQHRLGRIYELPGGARVLAVGERRALNAELFDDVSSDDASTARFGPWTYPLDGDAVGIFMRCRCGTYSADVARLRRCAGR